MADRLPWQRGDRPQHFVAIMPEGRAEIWLQPTGTQGAAAWRGMVTAGETINSFPANDKQNAADQATTMWRGAVLRERARVDKIEQKAQLEQQLDDAFAAGSVDVMAFGLGTANYDRLIQINESLRRNSRLTGPLAPLAAAVSAELYRRRTAGR